MKVGIVYVLAVVLLLGLVPTGAAQELELSAPPLYLNPSQCAFYELFVTNINSQDIFHIDLEDQMNVPNCCSITTSKHITILESGVTDTIPLRVCSPPSTDPGVFVHTLHVSTVNGDADIPFYIHVTQDFEAVLRDRISRIQTSLDIIERRGLTTNQAGLFITARALLQQAETSIAHGDFEFADMSIDDAEALLIQIKNESGGSLVAALVITVAVVVFIIVLILLIMFRALHTEGYTEYRYGERIEERPRPEDIIKKIELLQTKLSVINTRDFSRVEKFYYESACKDIEKVKEFVADASMDAARKALNNAEMNLKVLEHRLVSLNLFREVKNLFEVVN
jgi:hypothetical protein